MHTCSRSVAVGVQETGEERNESSDGVWQGLPEGTRNSPGLNAAPLKHFLPMTPGSER